MSIHLVSDDLIDSGATLYATEHDYASIEQAYERGAKSLRDIYEAELQSMRERLSRMEEAGNAMAKQMKFWADYMGETDNQRGEEMVTKTMAAWNAALSNK